jgi:putative peptide zinc metalloprotease protein
LTVERIQYLGLGYWVVKDPVALRYYRFQPEQYAILKLLDGERNLDQIRDEFHREFPTVRLTTADIQNLISDLHRTGLVFSNRPGQGIALLQQERERKRKQIIETVKNILYVRLPGWDPERTLKFIHPYFKWMYTPAGVGMAIVLVLSSWLLLLMHFKEFQARLPEFQQFFGWPNLMYLWFVLGASKVIHEFGHGLTCKHFRGECHEMGILLLVLSPCLYCDVSDSWLLQNKWKRIMIGAAGMYIEVILSAFAIFGWWYSRPGLFNYLCLNLFFVSTVTTVIFNANPLLRYDGYYMMSDWLEIPNLRPKADRLLREKFAWFCLGIESRPDPFMPQTGQFWFILFAIAAGLYRWVVLAGVLLFFYTFLKPYKLQSIGIMLATFSASMIVVNLFVNVYRIVSTPRIEPMSYPKIALTTVALSGLLAAILMVPMPWYLEAPLVIEPHDVRHVYTGVGGLITEPTVQPGERVQKDQVLARLSDLKMEEDYRKLKVQRSVQKMEWETQMAIPDLTQAHLAAERLDSLQKQLADYEHQLAQLVIRAPCNGTVVAPPRVPEPKLDVTRTQLPRWHGSPLAPRNVGCFLEPRTHLLSIAPDENFQAVLLIDQTDRNDIAVGEQVRLKLDHLPDRTYRGKVAEISMGHEDFAPAALSNKQGGGAPTVTDAQGRERLTSAAYQATAPIDESASLLRAGMRGRARVTVATRSPGQWVWRSLRRTFHFML